MVRMGVIKVIKDQDDEAMVPTSARGHIDQFMVKMNTILLVCHSHPIPEGYVADAGSNAVITISQIKQIEDTLKEYQMAGLRWLVSLHNNNLNGITNLNIISSILSIGNIYNN